jgi:hypothetical protein
MWGALLTVGLVLVAALVIVLIAGHMARRERRQG